MQNTSLCKNTAAFAESTAGEERILAPITSEVDDQYALLNLNPVAAFIWDQLELHDNETELVQALRDAYEIDEVTARQDVTTVIELLIAAGAVQRVEPAERVS